MDNFVTLLTIPFGSILNFIDIKTVLGFVCIILAIYVSTKRTPHIPPGPRIFVPVLGNLPYLLPDGNMVRAFRDLRVKHGDVFSIYLGHKLTIIINGYDAIHDALITNANIFSDRPDDYINFARGLGITFNSGETWKQQRRFTVNCLKEFGFGKISFEDKIMTEVKCFIEVLEKQAGLPFDFDDHIQINTANVVFSICTNKRHAYEDEEFTKIMRGMKMYVQCLMKAGTVANCFPFLQRSRNYLPYVKTISNIYQRFFKFVDVFYFEHLNSYDKHNPRDLIDMYITRMKEMSDPESTPQQLRIIIFDLLVAGSETTSGTIQWFTLYLVHFPEVQIQLQKDIDEATSDGHELNLDDRNKLPRVDSFIMEVQRITTLVPLLTHAVAEDVLFRGYRIPKDSVVIINYESHHTDPTYFEDPNEFKPFRFLDSHGDLVTSKNLMPFGIGRRSCLGEVVAKAELFLFLVYMLKEYNFKVPNGAKLPSLKGVLDVTNNPQPFQICALKRRDTNGKQV